MTEKRYGEQTPTKRVFIEDEIVSSDVDTAIDEYNKSPRRKAQPWQRTLLYYILAVNSDGVYVHSKFGFSVPRRNGKNEVDVIRELYGLLHGQRIMHTAHRTATASAAFERLYNVLKECGYKEGGGRGRQKKDAKWDFKATRQSGKEHIEMSAELGGGYVNFRTRSSQGGLGEGYDLLIVDEAQEYTDDQETALKYVVSDSMNPQTLFMGTPPTTVSTGTVFLKMRNETLQGERQQTGWAEWSVDTLSDVNDRELWYKCNPAMGYHLNERKIEAELGSSEETNIDFNIQRLGLWIQYNQKSAISEADWDALKETELPPLTGKLFAAVRFGHDGERVSLSLAVRTEDDRILVEGIDCRPVKAGNEWILQYLDGLDVRKIVVEGANGQASLADAMRAMGIKSPVLPRVEDVIKANASFESAIASKKVCHMGQPSLRSIATNVDKRLIGTKGGFGYKSIREDLDVSLLDSAILAYWSCMSTKPGRPAQTMSY